VNNFQSSLEIVEDFFGETLSDAHARLALGMPLDQMFELADRLASHRPHLEQELIVTSGPSLTVNDVITLRGGVAIPVTELSELKYLALLAEKSIVPDLTLDWARRSP
jgi:hypothetical protein